MSQTSFSNYQSSLALTQAFATVGVYPSQDGGGGGAFLDEIFTFAFNFVPPGTLAASGELLPINQNQAVFSLVGTTYGGNGTTNFTVPNLNGVTMIGDGQGAGLPSEPWGTPTGSSTTTLTRPQLPPDIGGTSQPIDNYQPSLPVTYMICVVGVFPSRDSGGGGSDDMLGEVVAFSGNFAPRDYVQCNGQLLSIAQNQALFSILGTTYGGDGRTTFALPDLRGRTIIGASSATPLGSTPGTATLALTNAQAPDGLPHVTQPVDEQEPSLALNYLISLFGIYPSQDGGSPTGSTPVIGQIMAFAGNFAPSGWAFADGSLLSIASNAALFQLIGTTYGGDGVNTFALPNLRGKTVIGTNGSALPLGATIGADQLTISTANLPLPLLADTHDFNGDSKSDISFQNPDGLVAVWDMNGASILARGGFSGAAALANPGTAWKLVGAGDFFGDRSADLLLQNTQSGALAYWGLTQGASGPTFDPMETQQLPANLNPGSTWQAVATGDFNGDGYSDIAFQNNDSSVAVWEMNGSSLLSNGAAVLAVPGTNWHLRATGDFYDDGTSDLLLQNDDGSLAIWEVTQSIVGPALNLAETTILPANLNAGPNWVVKGTGDFNDDGHSDFVFQNSQTGDVAVWEMNGASLLNAAVVASPGTAWAVKSIGDYNGDGMSDISLQNSQSGQFAIWFMNGLSLLPSSAILSVKPQSLTDRSDFNNDSHSDIAFQNNDGTVAVWEMNGAAIETNGAAQLANPGTAWKLIGSGDFYGDGSADLLLQNQTGALTYWGITQGASGPTLDMSQTLQLPNNLNPGASWQAVAIGDFNDDGYADIAFQNNDGTVAVWEMNGASLVTNGAATFTNPSTAWHLRATGDFYGDGTSDLAFQNDNGSLAIWGIDQSASGPVLDPTETVALPANLNPGSAWVLEGTGDFNGDGKSDFVFQNTQTGDVTIWEMNGASLIANGAAVVASPGTAWAVKSIGDYNGDGMSDILLQDAQNGALAMWFMNGLSLLPSSTQLSANPGTTWSAVS